MFLRYANKAIKDENTLSNKGTPKYMMVCTIKQHLTILVCQCNSTNFESVKVIFVAFSIQ